MRNDALALQTALRAKVPQMLGLHIAGQGERSQACRRARRKRAFTFAKQRTLQASKKVQFLMTTGADNLLKFRVALFAGHMVPLRQHQTKWIAFAAQHTNGVF